MKLVRIEAGSFCRGAGAKPPASRTEWIERDYDESPAHVVKISKPFRMSAHEVTNAQYERFDPAHKAWRNKFGASQGDDHPVTFVSWDEANAFCAWLSKQEGKPYRLPTEAEWEYACRAGATTPFSFGDDLTAEQANLGVSKDGKKPLTTTPVGSYPANAWGLHDMHGNVAEWCLDWHGTYVPAEQTDPVGRANGYARIVRGWSYQLQSLTAKKYARSANRAGHLPDDANRCVGFRVVQADMPATKLLPAIVEAYQRDVQQNKVIPEHSKGPAFVNWSAAKKQPTIPKDSWGPIFSQHNHFAAVTFCPNGDLLAAWYTTVSEAGRELAMACSRLRAGSDRWDDACLFFDVPDVNDHAPVLFCDGKRIYHFGTQSLKGWDDASNFLRWSDDNGVTWSQPKIIIPRHGPLPLSQPCQCIVDRKTGVLILACDGDNHRDERVAISEDGGKSWKVQAGDMRAVAKKYVIHPAIVQKADGSLLSFMRGPHPMPAYLSNDRGDTWTEVATPFPGISVGQRIAAMKLASGAIVVVSHDNKNAITGGVFAAISDDDGATWKHVRKVDGVSGYMAVTQSPNGMVHVFGTRMSAVSFNEAWLREGMQLKERP
ncbi:MAG: SUMF1/EgtB/PvdO family nonheme iron enzyme [Gemmataceae bacterium]